VNAIEWRRKGVAMMLGIRILTVGAAASLAACSVADPDPSPKGQAGLGAVATGSGGKTGGAGGTSSTSTGTGSGSGGDVSAAAGAGGSTGGDGTGGGNGVPVVEAGPPAECLTPQYTHLSAFGAIFDGWSIGTTSVPFLATGIDGGSVVVLDPADGSPA